MVAVARLVLLIFCCLAPADTALAAAVPPVFSKSFAPSVIEVGGESTLTFTIDNSANAVQATNTGFVDVMPAGIEIESLVPPPRCNGDFMMNALTDTVEFDGVIAAGESCTLSIVVSSAVPGAHVNTSGDLISSLGNSGPASDTLTVTAVIPGFSKSFAPDPIVVGGTSILTFTLDNSANAAQAINVGFADTMPPGVELLSVVPGPRCGGDVNMSTATDVVSFDGVIEAGETCTISVEVGSSVLGDHLNTSGDLTSSLGNSGPAADTLSVLTVLPPRLGCGTAP